MYKRQELSALIDWCQITIKEVPLEAVIEDVLRIPRELMTVTGYEKGIAGHEVCLLYTSYFYVNDIPLFLAILLHTT